MTKKEDLRIEIIVFGNVEDPRYKNSNRAVEKFLKKNHMTRIIRHMFYDMNTVDGLAEGAYHDVMGIPTTIINKYGEVVKRWDSSVPSVRELESAMDNL